MSDTQDCSKSDASDDTSESDLLDKSLSLWKGWSTLDKKDDFLPVLLDIHTACSLGLLETVRELATRQDFDRKNKGGWTPLMYASYIGHYAVVNFLLGNGVDVNTKNHKGQTPLILAASCGNENVGHLLCQNGAQLEAQDKTGATALFHATYSGHQNMVLFLLEQGANFNRPEPTCGMTPLMQAAMEGHEIIVQIFLNHGVNVDAKAYNGDTARSVALLYGHTKIVSLIENHVLTTLMRSRHDPRRPNIRDGPEAFDRYLGNARGQQLQSSEPVSLPQDLAAINSQQQDTSPNIRSRDMIQPITADDYTLDSSGDRGDEEGSMAFSKTGAITVRSSSSSSGGLAAALGLSADVRETQNNNVNTNKSNLSQTTTSVFNPKQTHVQHLNTNIQDTVPSIPPEQVANFYSRKLLDNVPTFYSSAPINFDPNDKRPKDLSTFLEEIGMSRYLNLFVEEDVDFPVFLSLTENHLSEIGIKLFGHRRKLAIAITRWHSNAPQYNGNNLEQVYANRLESEIQETSAILHQTYEQMERLRAQVLQEEELRSVTESCLMEEKGAWQRVHRVTMDTRQTCVDMHECLRQFSLLFKDMRKHTRHKTSVSSHLSYNSHADINSLTNAIKDSFSLEDSSSRDTYHISSETVLSNMETLLQKLQQSVVIATMNCDVLLSQAGETT